VIVPAIESVFRVKFLSKDVYLIPELPSDLQWGDVISISLMALGLLHLGEGPPLHEHGAGGRRVEPTQHMQ